MGGVGLVGRVREHVARVHAEERDAELAAVVADRCPVCGHSRAEQQRLELVESVARSVRRLRGQPLRPAQCGATAGQAHVITPCTCRAAFHGS